MTLPMLALRDSGVELGTGDWVRYEWQHTSLLSDEPRLIATKAHLTRQTSDESGHPEAELAVVTFTHRDLLESWEKHHHEWFGDDPSGELPANACALVCYWKKPLLVTVDDRPRCPRCGTPMNATTAFLCGPGAPGGIALPPTCPSRDCAGDRDREAIRKAIEAGVIDP